jgi:hypothetical protein
MSVLGLKTTVPDKIQVTLSITLLLSDQFTRVGELVGAVSVTLAGKPLLPPYRPLKKDQVGTFCFVDLPNGGYTMQVRSEERPPLYQPVDITLSVPQNDMSVDPKWPAYPNLALANRALPLDDPGQPVLYRNQRSLAMLKPSIYYPFPTDATLIRGSVLASGNPVEGATVRVIGGDSEYVTGQGGHYVLFLRKIAGLQSAVGVRTIKTGLVTNSMMMTARRGETVSQDIVMS